MLLLGALALGRTVARCVRARPAPGRRTLALERAAMAAAAAGLLCILYGRFVEPFRLTTTRLRIESAKLAKGAPPLRIAHFSDLHCEEEPRLEEALVAAIALEKPDLIAFTGDCLNVPEGLPVLRGCLTKLAAIAPTFVVRGNWDVEEWNNLPLFEGTGVRELDVERGPARLETRAGAVWLAGTPAFAERFFEEALRGVPREQLTVFLYHFPDAVLNPESRRIDLFLAGHTHGGQVALPFYGALVTFSKLGKRFEAGLYEVPTVNGGTTRLHVNRGVGTDGGSLPPVRFLVPPELTIIEVAPSP